MSDIQRQQIVSLLEAPRDYRTEIPNIVYTLRKNKKLSKDAVTLYTEYKRTAGSEGVCWKGFRTLSKETGLSTGQLSKVRKELEKPFEELGDQPLIIVKRTPKKENRPDEVYITDIWMANHVSFKKSLTCSRDERPCSRNEQKKEPLKKEPFKNLPPPSPPKSKPGKAPVSASPAPSAEEEDFSEKQKLLQETSLSPAQKDRLFRYKLAELQEALEIASQLVPKKTLMHLLLDILANPGKYDKPEALENLTEQQRLALQHNEEIRQKGFTQGVDENAVLIREKFTMKLFGKDGEIIQISLRSPTSEIKKDISDSKKYLEKQKENK